MIEKLGINYHDLKTKNRSLILKLLATGKCSSRIELAKESGLTKMSVSNIISDFITMGLVEESHIEETHGVGRSPIILDINKKGPKVVGLHIGREGCSVALYDLKLNKINSAYGELVDKTKEGLVSLIINLIDGIIDRDSVIAIGIGTIGPLDLENGVILNPPNFFGITNIHIVDILRDL